MPDAPVIEAPDNSAPAQTTQTPTLGATPQETFRNAMKAEADAAGARSQQADPAPEPKTVETKQTSASDDIPDALLSPKKADVPPADAPPELHGNVSPRTREHFDRQKQHYEGKLKTHQDEVAALRKEIEGYKSSNGKPSAEYQAALDAAIKQRDELNERMERIAYEHSDKFRSQFTEKEQRLHGAVEKIFKDAGLDESILGQAMGLNGKRRDDFLDEQEIGFSTKTRINNLLTQLDVLQDEKGAEIATSREKLAAMRAEEKAEEAREMEKERSVFETIKARVPASFMAFKEIPGDTEWNATIAERHEKAHQLAFGNNTNETLYEYAYAAVAAEATEKINEKLLKKVELLEARLAGTLATEPGTNGRDRPAASEAEMEAKMSPEERARATFNRLVKPVLGY